MPENPSSAMTPLQKAAKLRLLAEDLRADDDRSFVLEVADEYERLETQLPKKPDR